MACAQLPPGSCDCSIDCELGVLLEPQALDLLEDIRRLPGVGFLGCVDCPPILVKFRSGCPDCPGPCWRFMTRGAILVGSDSYEERDMDI